MLQSFSLLNGLLNWREAQHGVNNFSFHVRTLSRKSCSKQIFEELPKAWRSLVSKSLHSKMLGEHWRETMNLFRLMNLWKLVNFIIIYLLVDVKTKVHISSYAPKYPHLNSQQDIPDSNISQNLFWPPWLNRTSRHCALDLWTPIKQSFKVLHKSMLCETAV